MNLEYRNKLKEALVPVIADTIMEHWTNSGEVKALGLDLKDALQILDSNQEVAECISMGTWSFIKTFFEASIDVCEELYQDNQTCSRD